MGNWFSTKKNNTNTNTNTNKNYSKPPKTPTYLLGAAPQFRALLFRNDEDMKKLMVDDYKIFNKNLNKDNFAEVFIHKIMNDQNLDVKAKIKKLEKFSSNLNIRSRINPNSKSSKGIKNAAFIIKDNYDIKYKKQIQNAIEKLKNSQNPNKNLQNLNTTSRNLNTTSQISNTTSRNLNTTSRNLNTTSQNPNKNLQNPNKNL